jgi:hypothetical protein
VEKAEHPITLRCRCLHVTRSGFYASQRRPPSRHAEQDSRLRVLVRTSFDECDRRYGSPRILKANLIGRSDTVHIRQLDPFQGTE